MDKLGPLILLVAMMLYGISASGDDSHADMNLSVGGDGTHMFVFSWTENGWADTDPVFVGERSVYLRRWGFCIPEFDVDRLQIDVESDFTIVDFQPAFGVENVGTDTELDLLFSECGRDQSPLGVFTVLGDSTSGRICATGTMAIWDCSSEPVPHPISYGGCRAGLDTPSCQQVDCPVDFVVPESWSRVKATYR